MKLDPIYGLRPSEVYKALDTSPDGLSSGEVAARQELYGLNVLVEEAKPSHLRRFLSHVTHPLAILLWIAGGISFGVREPVLGLVIWILVLVNAWFSFWREYRAELAMDALRRLLPVHTRVVRKGIQTRVPAPDIVPGDVLILEEGDHIPADARVVEEYSLRTNNAALTGEAIPSRKTADASLRDGISEVERPNLIFAGTSVVSGTGRAVVYATGMLTQFGRISHLTQSVKEVPGRIQKEFVNLTRKISFVALGFGAVVFLVGALDVGLDWLEAFLLALGIIVAAIPEGLPATLTLSLAMAGQRLAQRGVLVKKLSVIETLGTVSMICADKSGTLTKNQMTVREIWVAGQKLNVSGVGYEPKGRITTDHAGKPFQEDLRTLLVAADLCNNARLNPPTLDSPQWTSLGDQTEAALRVAALKGGIQEPQLRQAFPRIHELPFDARRKRMSTIHQVHNGALKIDEKESPMISRRKIAFVKGSPREILQICTHIRVYGQDRLLDETWRSQILTSIDDYAGRTLRVLALARKELPLHSGYYEVNEVERNLTFLGLMAMHDPPRPEITEAIKVLKQSGIRLVMITGDYGLTAVSLARRVGMLNTKDPVILTGAELDNLSEIDLQALLHQEIVFARMAPEHKLRLVSAFQARGEVVLVTGDGVNDAPALRKADVGVAMGVIGTDVAKEAADLVIMNDNFASIVHAVEEGRTLYTNLRKFITYIFSSNVPEILPFLLTALFKIPLALNVRQILAIDLGTDLFPGLALGGEKPEPDTMRRPPRAKSQPVVDAGLLRRAFLWLGPIEAILSYSGFFITYVLLGRIHLPWIEELNLLENMPHLIAISPDQIDILAVTVYHAGVVTAQIGNAFACRTEINRGRDLGWLSNRFLLFGIFFEVGLILLLIYFPPLAGAFYHYSLPPVFWVWLLGYAPVLYSLEWVRKRLLQKSNTGHLKVIQ